MRAIDADRLLEERRIHTYYHLPNGDIAIPLIDIKNAPTIEPEPKWIPCSERLPEAEKKHYWVCTDTGYQCQCRWTNINHFWTELTTEWHWHIMDTPQYSKVIAWMPLPEPYTERREE